MWPSDDCLKTEELRDGSYSRTTSTDPTTGSVTVAIDSDSGEQRDLEHGLVSGSWFKERFHIQPDDPLSARATAEWEQTGGREGTMWRTHVKTEMTCDADRFYTTAKLTTFVEGDLFFEHEYKDSVPRRFV